MNNKIVIIALCIFANSAWAGSLTVPNTFTSGTKAVAAEVNENFSAVKNAIDDNDSRIGTNKADIASHDSRITTNKADITTNDGRITANETAIAAMTTPVLVDGSSTVIGTLLGTDSSVKYWVILNTQNYLVRLRADGFPAWEVVYFTGSGCTGTPYLYITTSGSASSRDSNYVYAKRGYVFTDSLDANIYYIAPNSGVTTITHNSRYLTSGCQNTTATIDAVQAAINVPGVTGVPDSGYGPVSLQ